MISEYFFANSASSMISPFLASNLIAMLLSLPYDRVLYKELYSIMRLVCEEASAGVTYSNFFSMLGVVCDRYHVPKSMAARLQSLRRRSNRSHADAGVTKNCFIVSLPRDTWTRTKPV